MFTSAVRTNSRRQPPCSQIDFPTRLYSAKKKRVHSWPSSHSHKGAAFLDGYLALGAFLVIVPHFPRAVQCCLSPGSRKEEHLFIPLFRRETHQPEQWSYGAALERTRYFLSACPAHEWKPTGFGHLRYPWTVSSWHFTLLHLLWLLDLTVLHIVQDRTRTEPLPQRTWNKTYLILLEGKAPWHVFYLDRYQ